MPSPLQLGLGLHTVLLRVISSMVVGATHRDRMISMVLPGRVIPFWKAFDKANNYVRADF